jgi:hypothetical protein
MGLGSEIRDLISGIQKKPFPNPGSRGQKGTGYRIQIRNATTLSCRLLPVLSESCLLLFNFFFSSNFTTPRFILRLLSWR